jgi:hypothetical protein
MVNLPGKMRLDLGKTLVGTPQLRASAARSSSIVKVVRLTLLLSSDDASETASYLTNDNRKHGRVRQPANMGPSML